MEKGTRLVRCPHCLPEVTRIRIQITVAVYGKSVKVPCPKCLQDFWTDIPVPAAEPTQKQSSSGPFSGAFEDIFDLFKSRGRGGKEEE